MRVVAIVVSLAITAVAVALTVKAVRQMTSVIRAGGPTTGRTDNPVARWRNMTVETLGHTRMLQLTWVGIMHWFVMAGFIFLSSLVFGAYLQIFDAHQAFPVIGHWRVYEWPVEALSWATLVGILFLIAVRQRFHPRRLERRSRFFGSTFWQAYFVEAVILIVVLLGIALRTLEYALLNDAEYLAEHPDAVGQGTVSHFPSTFFLGELWTGLSLSTLENIVYALAMVKIVVSMTWLIVIARNISMGIAWHRFTAWFNIWFKRESDGSTALGGLQPIVIGGKALDMEAMEDLEEEDFEKLGVGKVEDFSWKGILDFTTCTECGRCQSQCPAWNTEKPLSPKLLVLGLREHAYAKIPLLDADPETLTDDQRKELERPLIGDAELFGVIDPDVLWSCTNCGACVQQCPVDIEHVDHIQDMRRFQVLVESNFPAELNNIFKGLERKGNPWGMNAKHRMDWAKDLDFEVKQVGVDVESLDEVEWLFWVGCAGAFEDRAKKTTQAVAELLNTAGVDFAVLGDGETCTGDPARRAGNEIVFMQLAMENAEVFKETKVKKVVSTCAHCFNTLKNEYAEFGVELEVVHHTQLLNRLVREKRLTPVAPSGGTVAEKTITYHDPCFLGRHNQVYEAPRELLEVIPGATFSEMPRNSERSFCCGAGGARMWMEESIGSRINVNRTEEAVATGADQIAVGCPFCRVMLSDGLTAQQAAGNAREEVEVLDVAQLLLAAVKRVPVPVGEGDDVVSEAEAVTAAAAGEGGGGGKDSATDAEPDADDRADDDSISDPEVSAPLAEAQTEAGMAETEATSGESVEELDEPARQGAEVDREIAAKHNIDVDDEGTGHLAPTAEESAATPDEPEDAAEPKGEDVPAVEEVPEPEPEPEPGDTVDPEVETATEEADADGEGEDSGGKDADASPAKEITHVPDETERVQEDEREEESEGSSTEVTNEAGATADAEGADDKEAAAWANVGPVNTDASAGAPAAKADDSSGDAGSVTDQDEPADDAADESTAAADDTGAPDSEDMDEKEAAAWANVGAVNTDLTPDAPAGQSESAESETAESAPTPDPEPEPGDTVDPEVETATEEADEPSTPAEGEDDDTGSDGEPPAGTDDDVSPGEEITDVPDETELVQEDEREEEADASSTEVRNEAKASAPEGVVSVEDAPSTADPVSDDAAPLTEANPSGSDLSEAATQLSFDDVADEDPPTSDGDPDARNP